MNDVVDPAADDTPTVRDVYGRPNAPGVNEAKGNGIDGMRLEWIWNKAGRTWCSGGRSVLGKSEHRDPRFVVAIDDEAFLRVRGRVPFDSSYCESHVPAIADADAADPFADDTKTRAAYIRERRVSRYLENASMPHAHLLASGSTHSVVVDGGGEPWRLEHGEAVDEQPSLAKLVMRPPYVIRAVSAGWTTFLLLAETGAVYGCGVDEPRPLPVEALVGVRCRAIGCGSEHQLAATDDGRVFSWGRGDGGRLGHGDERNCDRPRLIDALSGFRGVAVAGGLAFSMVLSEDANGLHGAIAHAFGENHHGQLGVGHFDDLVAPERVAVKKLSCVSLGAQHSVLVNDKGDCFGCGCGYRNGHEDHKDLAQPRRLPGLRGVNVKAVSAGRYRSLAAGDDGRVYAWGGDRVSRTKSTPAKDALLRVDCDACHVCRRRAHLRTAPPLAEERARLQARESSPFWPFPDPAPFVSDEDPPLPADPEIWDYPNQPCALKMTVVHAPYVVEVTVSVRRDVDGSEPFFLETVRSFKWRVDPYDSLTLILTRGAKGGGTPVEDFFTFEDRGRAAHWCFVLDQWYVWEPL